MKKFKVASHFSHKALKKIMNSQTEVRAFQGWQIILLGYSNPTLSAQEIADRLGISLSKVYLVVRRYNKFGKNWYIGDRRGGRRESRCHLTLGEEKTLMKSLEAEALSGNILIFRHIKAKVEAIVGKEVSDDYIWDLFSRHKWSKKVPRPHHPKADKAAQEEYKKNSAKIWMPNH
jgi:transposase